MKRFILFLLILFVALTVSAQTQWYRTTSFAYATVYNGQYTWSNWEQSDMNISINLSTDIITIYSPTRQTYKVVDSTNAYTDNSGGKQIKFYVIDQDNDRGTIRLRVQKDGTSQLYVDFNDCAWVYCVYRQS